MFGNDCAYFRVAEFKADLPTDFCMKAAGFYTECFGNIMQESPDNDFLFVRQGTVTLTCPDKALNQRFSNPGNNKGVCPDIIKHCKSVVQLKTLIYGR